MAAERCCVSLRLRSQSYGFLWPWMLTRLAQRSSHSLNVIGRLKPGITVAQATAEMDAIQQRLEQQYPTFYVGSHVKVVPLAEQIVGTARRPLLVLWGAVAFVLLISCANVANLLLSRSSSRKKEFALRAALGAGRIRIIRQLLTESLLLSIAGGIAGNVAGSVGCTGFVNNRAA